MIAHAAGLDLADIKRRELSEAAWEDLANWPSLPVFRSCRVSWASSTTSVPVFWAKVCRAREIAATCSLRVPPDDWRLDAWTVPQLLDSFFESQDPDAPKQEPPQRTDFIR